MTLAEHEIRWEETVVLDHCGGQKLDLREALHIQMKPAEEHFNQKWELELLGCWRTADTKGRALPLTSNVYWVVHSYNSDAFVLLLLEIHYS